MSRNVWLGISIVIMVWMAIYIIRINQEDFNLSQQSSPRVIIELWASTPAVIEMAKHYDSQHPELQINTRYFYNQDLLLEELYGAISATAPPDIAEIGAHYGIYPLIESKAILKLNDWLPEDRLDDLVPGIASRYTYQDDLWAWPLGASLPVIYYNQTLLMNNGIFLPNRIQTWDELWQLSSMLLEKQTSLNGKLWGFHTDLNTSWYLMTHLRQKGDDDIYRTDPERLTPELFEEWSSIVWEQKLMPPLTHQSALTQFVNGQGGFLLSSTEKLSLIEGSIAGKFEWGVLPIPKSRSNGAKGYTSGGSGLVAFDGDHSMQALQFIEFAADQEQAVRMGREVNYIPAQLSLLQNSSIFSDYRINEHLRTILKEALDIEVVQITAHDHLIWSRLLDIQEQLESKGMKED